MNDQRKHRAQMSTDEIGAVETLVHAQEKWTLGPHAKKKMWSEGVHGKIVRDVLRTGRVIEVNRNNDLCAVFRKDYGDSDAVCVVVSLATRWVVTVWRNYTWDNHATLVRRRYRWTIDLNKELAAFSGKG